MCITKYRHHNLAIWMLRLHTVWIRFIRIINSLLCLFDHYFVQSFQRAIFLQMICSTCSFHIFRLSAISINFILRSSEKKYVYFVYFYHNVHNHLFWTTSVYIVFSIHMDCTEFRKPLTNGCLVWRRPRQHSLSLFGIFFFPLKI